VAKRIPPEKIEEIYNAASVVEVLGDYLQMKKRGTNYFALSPFVNEKTPSFAISPSKNIWKDFSTGKGGNAVTFLMEAEGMSYVEALKYIADKYHIALDLEESPEEHQREDHRESLYVLNEYAMRWFHNQMMNTPAGKAAGHAYFKERGILDHTIEEFQLGYSPDEWEAFSKEAIQKQYKEEYLLETGLVSKSDRDGRLFDRFRGRIIFPILNHLGKVAGFGGRILKKDEKAAKYINSQESGIYHKSYVLFGLHHARKAIRDLDRAILVEGYMDVVSLYQAGIQNAVASSGTALTVEQVRLLKRFTHNVLLIYDADRAGINAALRGIDILLEQEMNTRVLLLPEGEDPDSYVKAHGKSGFETFVKDKSVDFLDFKLGQLHMELDMSDPQQKTVAIHDVAKTLSFIPDTVKMAVYMELAAQKLSISPDVMQQSLNRALSERARMEGRQEGFRQVERQQTLPLTQDATAVVEAPQPIELQVIAQEFELLRLLLNYSERSIEVDEQEVPLVEFLMAQLQEVEFRSPLLESLKQEVFKTHAEGRAVDIHHFLNHKDSKIANTASRLVTIPFEISENWERFDIRAPTIDEDLQASVHSALQHYHLHHIRHLMKECQDRLKTAPAEEQDQLIKKYQMLIRMKQELTQEMGIILHE
jgi:DNA primase